MSKSHRALIDLITKREIERRLGRVKRNGKFDNIIIL
jgi:hypothetical protein